MSHIRALSCAWDDLLDYYLSLTTYLRQRRCFLLTSISACYIGLPLNSLYPQNPSLCFTWQMVVLDIKARLEATRSITPASSLSNPAISPVQRPQTGFFAREPSDRPPFGSNGTGSYDTATLDNSRHTDEN
jgi:hypothetical protein